MNYLKRITAAFFFPHRAFKEISPLEAKVEDVFPFLILVGIFKMRPSIYISIATIPSEPLFGFMQLIQAIVTGFFPSLFLALVFAVLARVVSKPAISWEQALAGAGYAYMGYALLVFFGALLNRFEIFSPYIATTTIIEGEGNPLAKFFSHFWLFFIYSGVFLHSIRRQSRPPNEITAPKWALATMLVLFALLPLASLAADGYNISKHYDELRPLIKGDKTDEFALPDSLGRTVRLSDFKGRPVLIDFFAPWCGVCARMEPVIAEMHNKYKERGLVVLGINTDDDYELEELRDVARARNLPFTVLQKQPKTLDGYRIRNLPTFVLLNGEGRVEEVFIGLTSQSSIENAIKKTLSVK
ncbi:MAG: hypothetical protein Kow0090_07680 [Myxococcota bacterium]